MQGHGELLDGIAKLDIHEIVAVVRIERKRFRSNGFLKVCRPQLFSKVKQRISCQFGPVIRVKQAGVVAPCGVVAQVPVDDSCDGGMRKGDGHHFDEIIGLLCLAKVPAKVKFCEPDGQPNFSQLVDLGDKLGNIGPAAIPEMRLHADARYRTASVDNIFDECFVFVGIAPTVFYIIFIYV